MSVKLVRLMNGEELVGKMTAFDENGMVLEKIVLLYPKSPTEMALAPFMAYGKEESIQFNPNSVMFVVTPIEQLEKQYLEATSTIHLL